VKLANLDMSQTLSQWVFVTFEPEFWGLNEINGGGGAIRPYELFTTLSRLGAECYVFETERNNPRVIEGVRVLSVLSGQRKVIDEAWKRIRTIRIFNNFCRAISKQQDRRICLWQKFPTVTFWKGGILPVPSRPFYLIPLAKKFGAYTWASIHDISPDYDISLAQRYCNYHKQTSTKWKEVLPLYLEQLSLKIGMQADLVTAVSEKMKRAGQERFGRNDIAVFSSGVNPKLVESISKWHPPEDIWTVGYLGSYLDGALDLLVEAVNTHLRSDVKVRLLVGTDQPEMLKSLMGNVNNCVEFVKTHYGNFRNVAEQVDLWMIPYGNSPMWKYYLDMTWPLKPPMYIASERPVIMTRTADLEHSGLKPYLFLTGTTPESMAETIDYVISHPEEASKRSEAGREFVLREMTWEKIVRKLVGELEHVVDERENAPAPLPD
jgi:glycosyltransferase involved in cell wall biosynthesis